MSPCPSHIPLPILILLIFLLMSDHPADYLRPLVSSQAWDYGVVWKAAGDPCRFLQFHGCCCTGSAGTFPVKEEPTDEAPCFCKDPIKHPVRTRSCTALLNSPPSLPLHGIHGDSLMLGKVTWIYQSNPPQEPVGTLLLVPVHNYLIELFAFKNMEEDHDIVEFVKSKFGQSRKKATTPAKNITAERNRRGKITKMLYRLRAVVPNISKMHQTAILDDAIEYIVKLENEVKQLRKETKEEENEKRSVPKTALDHRPKTAPDVEVKRIDSREFLLKIFHEKYPKAVVQIMEAVAELKLRVVDANVTTFNDKVLGVIRVQGRNDADAGTLRELLIRAF